MSGIIVSYRREDTGWITGRIFDELESRFGKSHVFIDIDTIPEGVDFRDHIKASLATADVVLAIIGPNWAGNRPGANPRIHDEGDWVRLEIETALAKSIPVIPVLIDRTQLPAPEELPPSIQQLLFIQAARLDSQRDFNTHIDRLIHRINELVQSKRDGSISRKAVGDAVASLKGRRQSRSTILSKAIVVFVGVIAIGSIGTVLFLRGSSEQSAQAIETPPRCLKWISAKDGVVPNNSIVGGEEPGRPLYVCRTKIQQDKLPGKLIAGFACYVAAGGGEIPSKNYEALVGNNCPIKWVSAINGVISGDALPGGTEDGQTVFICRAKITVGAGGVHIGRTGWTTDHKCLISYGNKQYSYDAFEVLTQGN